MNAIQFIQRHGVDKAMEVINGAPEGATHLSDDACHYVNADFKPLPAHIKEQLPKLIVIEHLKRLVESVDMVKEYGGISMAKRQCACFTNACTSVGVKPSPRLSALQQAIADYEAIYSGVHQ